MEEIRSLPARPTAEWRRRRAWDEAAVAAGTLDPAQAYAAQLYPDSMIASTDGVLAAYEGEVGGAAAGRADADLLAAVERVVVALNAVNEEHHGAAYETEERELLCDHVDAVLVAAGVDVTGLAARQGIGRHEITDRWRDW